jgi:RNA-directed DNA polymerase
MKALRHHCDCKWILLYVERWLTAPLQDKEGNITIRTRGTPQGGLCKALHKPPYAKKNIMQSKLLMN